MQKKNDWEKLKIIQADLSKMPTSTNSSPIMTIMKQNQTFGNSKDSAAARTFINMALNDKQI